MKCVVNGCIEEVVEKCAIRGCKVAYCKKCKDAYAGSEGGWCEDCGRYYCEDHPLKIKSIGCEDHFLCRKCR